MAGNRSALEEGEELSKVRLSILTVSIALRRQYHYSLQIKKGKRGVVGEVRAPSPTVVRGTTKRDWNGQKTEASKMPSKAEKPIKIVKRRERKLTVVEGRTPPANPQTPAQIRREMVSTIVSWVNDRKRSQRGCHRVVL